MSFSVARLITSTAGAPRRSTRSRLPRVKPGVTKRGEGRCPLPSASLFVGALRRRAQRVRAAWLSRHKARRAVALAALRAGSVAYARLVAPPPPPAPIPAPA